MTGRSNLTHCVIFDDYPRLTMEQWQKGIEVIFWTGISMMSSCFFLLMFLELQSTYLDLREAVICYYYHLSSRKDWNLNLVLQFLVTHFHVVLERS